MTLSPEISFPNPTASLDLNFTNSGVSITSRSIIGAISGFGTSIPTADFPGIGASMRIPCAARLRAMSSVRLTIRLTFTPGLGCNSNRVKAGPTDTFTIWALIPKLDRDSSSFLEFYSAVCLSFLVLSPPSSGASRHENGGNWYSKSCIGIFLISFITGASSCFLSGFSALRPFT